MSDVTAGTEYRGPSGIARDSVWLTNEDLPHDRDTPVTIEAVVRRNNVVFLEGRKKPVALSLRFVGKQRELLLNATHRGTLATLFGSTNCAEWFGKQILLHVVQNVRRPDGSKGPAVRIRARRVDQGAVEAPATDPAPQTKFATEGS